MNTLSLIIRASQDETLTLSEKMDWGLNGFIVGISCVFLVLVVLILFINLMSAIIKSSAKSASKAANNTKTETQSTSESDEDEVLAVISAAIACMSQRSGKKFKIKSFRRL